MNEKYDISLIIPFLNEAENIPFLISSLNDFFSSSSEYKAEVIFVDDGSNDNSLNLLNNNSYRYFDCRIISLSKNYGTHSALRAGIINASGEYITFNYADLQDPLELINRMFELCSNGKDIVWAVRSSTKSGLVEKILTKTYAKLINIFVNPGFPKNGLDIVMFNSKIKNELNKNIETNSSIFLQVLNLGFNQGFIYYDKRERKAGKTKWTLSKKIKLFIDSFVAFSYAPIRMVTIIGITFFFIGIFYAIYIILREIIIGDLAPGWPALISILMICFGISNISLGIIAEYLWRTLDVSKKRSAFIINEIISINKNKHT